jgi:hypothetical protein
MSSHPDQTNTPAAVADEAGAAKRSQAAGRGSSGGSAVDLTDDDIAAIAASELAPGFEHLHDEVDDV